MEQTSHSVRRYLTAKQVFLDLLFTIIIGAAIAAVLTATGVSKNFLISFVMSQSYGIPICLVIILLLYILNPTSKKIMAIALTVVAGLAIGILVGSQIGNFILKHLFAITHKRTELSILQAVVLWLAFGSAISYFFYSMARIKVSKEIIQQERINSLSSEKQALEANLKLLQAQIEPHFLFNTLSNILSLLDNDLSKGKSMLMDLTRYLRTSLAKTRAETTTLGQEMEMINAYLNIFKVRMEGRLHYRIDVPDNIKDIPFPPMLVQPLVENAIKHGIEPKIEGGEVTIRARKNGDILRVEIVDTGTGLHEDGDMGFGLFNVRERLQSLYGDRGRLILEENRPSGLKAIIEVPHGTDQGDHRG
jgi:sensor histidine kinase YesM